VIVEPAGRDEFLALMTESYGTAMSADEFDWWFDRNPAGPRILNLARDCGLAAFAVHAVTTPAARGRGVFSTLELQNEREAADAGAMWALGFTNPMAGPILVGKLGWEDVASLRVWARPKRLRKRGAGGLRLSPGVGRTTVARTLRGIHIARNPAYLDWRYSDSPRPYAQTGEAVVTQAVWHGYSSAVVCEGGDARSLRRAAGAVDADLAVALVNHGEERTYLAAGFVPTPRTIRFIGKRLHDDAPALPHDRKAWSFSLGDLDFF